MRYLVVGDPHCKPDNLYKMSKLFNTVEARGLPTVWLGDLLDTKDIVRAQCLNSYINYFRYSSLQHIILIGNHDWSTADCNQHSLEALKDLKNVTVVDRPYFEGKTLFVPYFSSHEAFKAAIKPYELPVYLFMHQGVTGCDYGNGFIAENELEIEALVGFDKVISGHFHRYQEKANLVYLGTPFSHSYGESNQDKFLGIFNDEDGSLELIKTDFPRHITHELDLNITDNLIIDEFDHVRVILKGTREQLASFNKSKYPGLKFIEDCQQQIVRSSLKETETPESLLSKWFSDIKKETNPDILNLGLDILKEVK